MPRADRRDVPARRRPATRGLYPAPVGLLPVLLRRDRRVRAVLLLLPAAQGLRRGGDRPADGHPDGDARAGARAVGLGGRSQRPARPDAARRGAAGRPAAPRCCSARPALRHGARAGGVRAALDRPAAAVRGHHAEPPRGAAAALRAGQAVGLGRLHPRGGRRRLGVRRRARRGRAAGAAAAGRRHRGGHLAGAAGADAGPAAPSIRPRRRAAPPWVLALLVVCILQQAARSGPITSSSPSTWTAGLRHRRGRAAVGVGRGGRGADVSLYSAADRALRLPRPAGVRARGVGAALAADGLGGGSVLPLLLFAQTCTWRLRPVSRGGGAAGPPRVPGPAAGQGPGVVQCARFRHRRRAGQPGSGYAWSGGRAGGRLDGRALVAAVAMAVAWWGLARREAWRQGPGRKR
jgi:hypothetical protein